MYRMQKYYCKLAQVRKHFASPRLALPLTAMLSCGPETASLQNDHLV